MRSQVKAKELQGYCQIKLTATEAGIIKGLLEHEDTSGYPEEWINAMKEIVEKINKAKWIKGKNEN